MLKVRDFLMNMNVGYYLDFICEVNKLVDMILDRNCSKEDIEDCALYIKNKFFRKEK